MIQPDPANPCFGCGGANARGMKLVFEVDEANQRITGHFRLGPEYQGATGFIHGGIIATVLDEVMSNHQQEKNCKKMRITPNSRVICSVRKSSRASSSVRAPITW